jgi:adenylate kinase family enzyme
LSKRLRTYKECTQPIIKRFGETGKLATIDALGDAEIIFNRVKSALSLE